MDKKIKVLAVHSVVDESRSPPRKLSDEAVLDFALGLKRGRMEVLKEFEIVSLPKNLTSGTIPRGHDIYLLHPGDASPKDLSKLKREQPYSLLCCLNRKRADVTNEERGLYDYFLSWITPEAVGEIVALAKGRMGEK
jgi:hypothetical protein